MADDIRATDEREPIQPIIETPDITKVDLVYRGHFADAEFCQTVRELRDRGLVQRESRDRIYRLYPGTRLGVSMGESHRDFGDLFRSVATLRGRLTDLADVLALLEVEIPAEVLDRLFEADVGKRLVSRMTCCWYCKAGEPAPPPVAWLVCGCDSTENAIRTGGGSGQGEGPT